MDDKKIKVTSAEIITKGGTPEHPYYQIKYKQVGKKEYNVGFGSYQKEYVEESLETCFEIVKYTIDDRIKFETDFCSSRCPDIKSCDHRYEAVKCEQLYNAMLNAGFIEKEECIQNDEGIFMKCYRKVSVCPKSSNCQFGIMCLLGDKIEAECKVCEGIGRCSKANSQDALSCEKVQRALSDKNKVVQFPVNMDEMQRNILVELLNARKECTDENILTARGCVAIIDALFYLVKDGIRVGVDWGDPNGDKTGGLE